MPPGLVIQGEASLCPWQQLLRGAVPPLMAGAGSKGAGYSEITAVAFSLLGFPPAPPR